MIGDYTVLSPVEVELGSFTKTTVVSSNHKLYKAQATLREKALFRQ